MNYIKYFTNPMFNRESFAAMLRERMNTAAREVEDGVILDKDAFNAVSAAHMPHWAFINRKYINSDLHTRAATEREIFLLNHPAKYQLRYYNGGEWYAAIEGNSLDDLKETADIIRHAERVGIINVMTGNVVYEVEL